MGVSVAGKKLGERLEDKGDLRKTQGACIHWEGVVFMTGLQRGNLNPHVGPRSWGSSCCEDSRQWAQPTLVPPNPAPTFWILALCKEVY